MNDRRFLKLAGAVLLAQCLIAPPASALDLRPTHASRDLEGVKIPILRFTDGDKTIAYQPPGGWRATGDVNALQLYAPGSGQGLMKFLLVAKKSAEPATPEMLQAIARQYLPKDAQEVVLRSEVPSPFTLEERPCTEFIFSGRLFNAEEKTAICVVDRNETQWLVVVISAKAEQFETIHGEAIASLFSWRIGK
jgi:hypothetical protein